MQKDKEQEKDIGIVLYTDGGARPSRGYAGWGVHGYTYSIEPLDKPAKKKGIHTDHGYIDLDMTEKTMVKDDQWVAKLPKDSTSYAAVNPIEVIDQWGPVGTDDTNNRAELFGLIKGLELTKTKGASKVHFRMDSEYALKGISQWYPKWKANNWVDASGKERKNREDWEVAIALYEEMRPNIQITFSHVDGHSGDLGNDYADINATRGVFNARKGIEEDTSQTSSPKGYGNLKVEPNKLFAYQRGYFLANKDVQDIAKSGHHVYATATCGTSGKHDEHDGKAVSDRGFGLLYLKEPEPIVESIKQQYNENVADLYHHVVRMNLDRMFSSKELADFEKHGNRYHWSITPERIVGLAETTLAQVHKPAHLVHRTIAVFSDLELLLDAYLAQRDGTYEGQRVFALTDVTEHFFEEVPLKKKGKEVGMTYQVHSKFTNLTKSMKLTVNTMIDGEVVPGEAILTTGLDFPHRNNFLGFAPRKPKVYVLTTDSSEKAFRHHVIIDLDEDVSLWTSYYSNTVYRLGGKK